MKKTFLFHMFVLIYLVSQAQTAEQLINVHNFNNLAAINAIINPNQGSFAYNTDNEFIYFFNGSTWLQLPETPIGGGWGLNGNSISSSNFLGPTNNQPLRLRTNNIERWRIETNGNLTPATTNIVFGQDGLISNTNGHNNIAIGQHNLKDNTTGHNNIAIGEWLLNSTERWPLDKNTTGNNNIAIGPGSSFQNITGSNNTAFGSYTATGTNFSNTSSLGRNTSVSASNQIRLGTPDIRGAVNFTGIPDARFKENLKDNVLGINFIMGLKPLTYNFNTKKMNLLQLDTVIYSTERYLELYEIRQIGFLAQEVEALADSLSFDFHAVDKPQTDKDIYRIRYAEFVAPIVKAIQEQQTILDQQLAKLEQQNQKLETQELSTKKLYNRIDKKLKP